MIERDPLTLAHAHGPDTAKEAATLSQVRKATNRAVLLERYARIGEATTEHVWLLCPSMDLAETRRRATDLLAAGLLQRTGRYATTTSGRNAEQLRISAAGRRVLYSLSKEAKS